MSGTFCRHCGQRIVQINYSTGPEWTHQPAGSSFQDGVHPYCQITRAEPKEVEVVDLVAALRASVEAAKKRREEAGR